MILPRSLTLQTQRVLGLFIATGLLLVLASCGFALRSSAGFSEQHQPIWVQSSQADGLAAQVRAQLQQHGTALAATVDVAKLILIVADEQLTRRVLSVSALTGKMEEVELTLHAKISATQPGGATLLEAAPLRLLRDYTFRDTEILAKAAEEEVLQQEMRREMAARVLRQARQATQ